MVTLAEDPPKAPTKRQRADAAMRSVIAGSEQGAVRRICLYLVLFVGMGVEYGSGLQWISITGFLVAILAAVLLIATDKLV